jgi:Ca2+-binding EF-hand superfamily protein
LWSRLTLNYLAEPQDEDNDGVLTVAEFIRWIETNKLVKLLEEGRDTDIDNILAKFQENEERSSSEEATDKNG